MTTTHTTPTEPTNQPEVNENPIDNMGNPVNPDGTPRDPEATQETPESVESLQKALKDTQAELTRMKQGKTEEPEKTETPEDISLEIKEKEEAPQPLIDFDKYSKEYSENGGLSEEAYKELSDKGLPKQVVDDYISNQEARVRQETVEVASVVGGEEKLSDVLTWASNNMTPEEVSIYNRSVNESTTAAKLALQGVYARYVEANGSQPNLMSGNTTNTQSTDIFKSNNAMVKAMEDPRYRNDPDYQKEVMEKAKRSQKAGTL